MAKAKAGVTVLRRKAKAISKALKSLNTSLASKSSKKRRKGGRRKKSRR